jgi:hypothetical protein
MFAPRVVTGEHRVPAQTELVDKEEPSVGAPDHNGPFAVHDAVPADSRGNQGVLRTVQGLRALDRDVFGVWV